MATTAVELSRKLLSSDFDKVANGSRLLQTDTPSKITRLIQVLLNIVSYSVTK